jgi:hypothetical protein
MLQMGEWCRSILGRAEEPSLDLANRPTTQRPEDLFKLINLQVWLLYMTWCGIQDGFLRMTWCCILEWRRRAIPLMSVVGGGQVLVAMKRLPPEHVMAVVVECLDIITEVKGTCTVYRYDTPIVGLCGGGPHGS